MQLAREREARRVVSVTNTDRSQKVLTRQDWPESRNHVWIRITHTFLARQLAICNLYFIQFQVTRSGQGTKLVGLLVLLKLVASSPEMPTARSISPLLSGSCRSFSPKIHFESYFNQTFDRVRQQDQFRRVRQGTSQRDACAVINYTKARFAFSHRSGYQVLSVIS